MTHRTVAGYGREKRPGDVGSPSPPPQVVSAPMTASTDSDDGSKEVSESNDRGPIYAEYRFGDDTTEVGDPTWAVMPTTPDQENVWLDLIGFDLGEWSAKFTPKQARQVAEALTNAAEACEDA